MQNNYNESDIIKSLRSGHKKAFDAIYEIYGRRLLAFCVRLTGSKEDAEDVAQDVFLNLWRNRDEIKQVDTLGPFLFIAARNRILNLWKTRLNSNLYNDYVSLMRQYATQKDFEHIEYREFEKTVISEIEKLPSTQCRVVRMSRFDNLDVPEIAKEMGLSVQTIKNALSVGLKTLRKSLDNKSGITILLLLSATIIYLLRNLP